MTGETPEEITTEPTPAEVAKALSVAADRQKQCGSPLSAKMMYGAAALIERQAAEIAELRAEIARLRAGGCARDQGLTQYCAEAAAFAAEVERLKALTTWRPISSAPMDGTHILIGTPDIEETDDHDGEAATATLGYWVKAEPDGADYMGHDAGFMDWFCSEFMPGRSIGNPTHMYPGRQPTHWLPLPAPPSVEVDRG